MMTLFLIATFSFLLFSYVVFRIIVRNDYLKHGRLSAKSWILEIIVFGLHGNLLYLALDTEWGTFPPFPENFLFEIISLIVFFLGIMILLLAYLGLGTKPSLGMDKNHLKTDGIYSKSRNPQLLGYGILLLLPLVLYFSWLMFIWFITYLVISYFMISVEEDFLKRKYGKEYENYCNTVSRII